MSKSGTACTFAKSLRPVVRWFNVSLRSVELKDFSLFFEAVFIHRKSLRRMHVSQSDVTAVCGKLSFLFLVSC